MAGKLRFDEWRSQLSKGEATLTVKIGRCRDAIDLLFDRALVLVCRDAPDKPTVFVKEEFSQRY